MKTSHTLPLLCAVALAIAPNLNAQSGWKPLLFDPISNAFNLRAYVSLTFNASGYPVLVYSDAANGDMKLATRSATNWTFETVGKSWGSVSLAMDSTDKPSFAWTDGALNFSSKAGGKWSNTVLDRDSILRGIAPSLAYSSSGPAISYQCGFSSAGGTEGLRLAWRTGSTWKTYQIDVKPSGAHGATGWTSLAVDPSTGQFAIAYTVDEDDDGFNDALKLATGFGTSWKTSFVERNIVNYTGECSLAFDPAGHPVIADFANNSLRVLRQSGGTWGEQIVAEQIVDETEMGNLAVSPAGKACIIYLDHRQVKVASADLPADATLAAEWAVQTVDADGTARGTPAISFSNLTDQTPHLAYFDPAKVRLLKQDATYPGNSNLFQDSMEATTTTWSTEGTANDPTPRVKPPGPSQGTALWHRTTHRGTDAGHSAATSWYYGIDGQYNYITGTRNWGRLISQDIFLPAGVARAELKVSQLVLAEGGSNENGEIQISVNGGAWTTLFKRANQTSASFNTDTVDLTAYLNQTIRIGFFFDTKDGTNNQYEGWYVDDVTVRWWP